ncbi:hypothetical protein N9U01_05555, partial [Paracoccaceae bacterium]|nr:hypothetical protein [Paracoccaceae bacterium]
IEDEIEIVTYIAGEGDISTDLLSPGNQAHSRADRELHGKCFISERAQKEIEKLKLKHPNRRVMLIAEKGTMGVGSSRMSGINNASSYLQESGNPFTSIAFDPSGKTAIDWGVTAPPETFILNGDGLVIFRFAGPLVGTDYENRFEPALKDALKD